MRSLAAGATALLMPAVAWADHGTGVSTEGWSPLLTALVFGGLSFLTGLIVVVIVSILTRGPSSTGPRSER